MITIETVSYREQPREILTQHFRSSTNELPIRGGWGYSKSDACIIDADDPIVNKSIPFNGIDIEKIFVQQRIYEELIICRPVDDRFSGIEWELEEQHLIPDGNRYYDLLKFNITAFRDEDWNDLKAEFEGPNGYGIPGFDLESHERKRQELMIQITRDYWFDITSFYQGRDW